MTDLPSFDGEEMHPLLADGESRHSDEPPTLDGLEVTYRRRRNSDADTHESLAIFVNGALIGLLTVRTETHEGGDERALLDVIAYALAGNGAAESDR
jgi:hypothetical protein